MSGPHEHQWQPNGIVREKAIAASPVSHDSCIVYDKAYSLMVCTCGETKRTHVANENQRSGYVNKAPARGSGYACVLEGFH